MLGTLLSQLQMMDMKLRTYVLLPFHKGVYRRAPFPVLMSSFLCNSIGFKFGPTKMKTKDLTETMVQPNEATRQVMYRLCTSEYIHH